VTEERLHEVNDRGKLIDFIGVQLGSSSSYAPGKPRWFEVKIFKSRGGKYVVSGAGRSVIVHRPTCWKVQDRANEQLTEPTDQSLECDVCWPDLNCELVIAENDREWAQVSDDPAAVIERLRLRDNDGVFYIPRTSMNALNQAAAADDTLAQALVAPQHVE
jgi:hypothetical protein